MTDIRSLEQTLLDCRHQNQPLLSHPRRTPDVGDGFIPERLLLGQW